MDRVRTLGRLVTQAKGLLAAEGAKVQQRCRSRLRTAQVLHRQLRRTEENKDAEQKKQYQTLVETTEHMVRQATQVVQHQRQATTVARRVLPLVERVISQTRRRVFEETKMPSDEKVLSLVEPHTKAVPRSPWWPDGGVRAAGHRRTRVEGGIITRDEIVAHPTEHGQPVAIPAFGKLSAERHALEHPRAFRRGSRFRAGTRGRMASLRRDHGWRACRSTGWTGGAVVGPRGDGKPPEPDRPDPRVTNAAERGDHGPYDMLRSNVPYD